MPVVEDVHADPPHSATELLRLAASVDQASGHVVAKALVAAAHRQLRRCPFRQSSTSCRGRGSVVA